MLQLVLVSSGVCCGWCGARSCLTLSVLFSSVLCLLMGVLDVEERGLKFCLLFKQKKNPCPWDVVEVCKWLEELGVHKNHRTSFMNAEIDGRQLLELNHADLEVSLNVPKHVGNQILMAVRRERWEEREEEEALALMERYRLARLETAE